MRSFLIRECSEEDLSFENSLKFGKNCRRRYLSLCCALEPNLSVKAKEDLATALVRIMHKQQMAKYFLCDLIMSEVDVLGMLVIIFGRWRHLGSF